MADYTKLITDLREMGGRLRIEAAHALEKVVGERIALQKHMQFVERWANHHGRKPDITPTEVLSTIQHYPPIKEITRSYVDGVVPETLDPWTDLVQAREQIAQLKAALSECLPHFEGSARRTLNDWRSVTASLMEASQQLAKAKEYRNLLEERHER